MCELAFAIYIGLGAPADGSLCPLQLKEIAPEYYDTLAFHKSWTWVTWKFLSDPNVGPWTRMRRPTREPVTTPATPDKAAALVRPTALTSSPDLAA